ncbi:hypothetical protein [Streptomyces sp. NBC_01367]|uniref:hypothetical protein n=1 Tax=Streptomyces sp. NBC_01367 TaxID=2903841 RepID=UPI00324347FB
MMTWQHLKDLKRTEYEEAADGWGEVSSRAYAAKERVENEMLAKLRDTQTAQTADAALGDLSRLARNFQYIHAECGLVRTTLNGFAAEVATPQSLLNAALEEAEGYGFTVHQDGSISYPAGTPSSPYLKPAEGGTAGPTPAGPLLPGASNPLSPAPRGGLVINPNKARAEGIAQRIASACHTAAEIDSRYRTALSELKVERGLRVDDKVWADAAKDLQRTRDAASKYLKDSDIPHGKPPRGELRLVERPQPGAAGRVRLPLPRERRRSGRHSVRGPRHGEPCRPRREPRHAPGGTGRLARQGAAPVREVHQPDHRP